MRGDTVRRKGRVEGRSRRRGDSSEATESQKLKVRRMDPGWRGEASDVRNKMYLRYRVSSLMDRRQNPQEWDD